MASTLRIGILAGEASGDLLGAGLMQSIRKHHPDVEFTGIGGPHMEQAGLDSQVPMERLAVMGLVDPLKRLPELLGIRKALFQAMNSNRPDVFIGIDAPEFNLGLERKLKKSGIPTVHYVSPSVWAWRQGRIKTIRRAVDLMMTLFPFEETLYRQHGIPVCCVGHPLADELPLETDITAAREHLGLDSNDKVLAILPGSRQGEVERLGPVFLETARLCRDKWPDLGLVIPSASTARHEQLQEMLDGRYPELDARLVAGDSRTVMAAADCVLMASGTAALEAMLLKKPMVVAYKMAPLSYAIISRMLKAPYISLPNLLAGKALVPELLQGAATPPALFSELEKLLEGDNNGQDMIAAWKDIHLALRRNANDTAAAAVLGLCGR